MQDTNEHNELAFIDLRDPLAPSFWTYKQFDQAVKRVASGLQRRGLKRQDRVAIISQNRVEYMITHMGILRAGMVSVPVNYKLPKFSIDHVIADCSASLIFAGNLYLDLVPKDVGLINFDEDEGDTAFCKFVGDEDVVFVDDIPVGEKEAEIAKILYTSGSTGLPKGVEITCAGQSWGLSAYAKSENDDRPRRQLIVAPFYHKNGLYGAALQLTDRDCVVSLPKFDPVVYLKTIAKYRCDTLSGVPTMFSLVSGVSEKTIDKLDLCCVSTIQMGSAPLTPDLIKRTEKIFKNAVIENCYGSTEAGPALFGNHPDGLPTPPSSLGYPLESTEFRLTGGASPKEGRFYVRTPAMMKGYLNLDELTSKCLVNGWFDTRDIMRIDSDGFWFFVSRADDMIICGGENIYPSEVEKLLENHPSIVQAVVVSVPDEIKGQIPVAFIIKSDGADLNEERVKKFALENGPAYAHPRHVFFRDTVPLAGTNKVDLRHLKEEAEVIISALNDELTN